MASCFVAVSLPVHKLLSSDLCVTLRTVVDTSRKTQCERLRLSLQGGMVLTGACVFFVCVSLNVIFKSGCLLSNLEKFNVQIEFLQGTPCSTVWWW